MTRQKRNISRLAVRIGCVLFLLLLPYLFSRLASPWRMVSLHSGTSPLGNEPDATGELRVVAYNIAHGRGNAPDTRNWTDESKEQRLMRLDAIADLLTELDADVVVLNEIDFESSWSHGVNQARHIAEAADYPFWVEQRNLDFRFLLWTWRFGNAVLSKHPIVDAEAIDLPSYSRWETVLAGKKRGMLCEIDVQGRRIRFAAVHLSHRSESLRVQSAHLLLDLAAKSSLPLIIAGDFNSTPPGFPYSKSDGTGTNAIFALDQSEQFRRLPMSPPAVEEMTFHSEEPLSVIDWILIPQDWEFLDYQVVPTEHSDHRPVLSVIAPPTHRP